MDKEIEKWNVYKDGPGTWHYQKKLLIGPIKETFL